MNTYWREVNLSEISKFYESIGVNPLDVKEYNMLNDYDLAEFLIFLRKIKLNYFRKCTNE